MQTEEYVSSKVYNKFIKQIAQKAGVTIKKMRDGVLSFKSNDDLDAFLAEVSTYNKTSKIQFVAHQTWRAGEGRTKVPAVHLIYNQKIPASMMQTYTGK